MQNSLEETHIRAPPLVYSGHSHPSDPVAAARPWYVALGPTTPTHAPISRENPPATAAAPLKGNLLDPLAHSADPWVCPPACPSLLAPGSDGPGPLFLHWLHARLLAHGSPLAHLWRGAPCSGQHLPGQGGMKGLAVSSLWLTSCWCTKTSRF